MRPHIPVVAIIGRTNVGKSTLFNRVIEQKKALVSAIPGTTRDRNEGDCLWRGRIVRFVDTGGLDMPHADEIERDVVRQAKLAMEKADLIVFVVDLKTGPLPQERQLALQLRKSRKPVLVAGNKAETPSQIASAKLPEWRLAGLPSPIPVSALRGTGSGDLLDAVYATLKKNGTPPAEITEVLGARVAVVGKPNVGKSSLLNAIVQEERFIVSPIAHTTREPIDTLIEVDGKEYVFIDTAGIRKLGKVRRSGGLEEAGVERTMEAVKRADIALFVVDASEPLGSQDRTLAGLLDEAHAGVIVVANKWDLIEDKTPDTINKFTEYIRAIFPFLKWAPVIFTSAKTGQRVENIFALIDSVQRARYMEIPEDELDEFFRKAVKKVLPTKGKGPSPPKVLGLKQVGVAPPKFSVTIRAKRTDVINQSYLRYLENQLHEAFDLEGTPVIVNARLPNVRAS
jgi:GTP-binding protein